MKKTTTRGFVRKVSRSLAECELLHLTRGSFDVNLAREQHAHYVEALAENGVAIEILPELPDLPDATFVEDTAILLDELAVICRPGTKARLPEVSPIISAIEAIRKTHRIKPPGTLEGGDVLRVGKTLYVGISSRTNLDGISQLKAIVEPFAYTVVAVTVQGCLHLKTGVTAPDERILIANSDWVDLTPFEDFEVITVPGEEPWGANTLPVNGKLLIPASFPRTAEKLSKNGFSIQPVDISEIQKAEAGLTCLSLLF